MKIRLISYFASLVMLAVGVTAIAEEVKVKELSKDEYDKKIAEFSKGNDCVFSRTISNWSNLDRKSLIIYAPTKKRPYYVELTRPSFELRFAHSIGIHSKFDNRFCPYGGNALFIDGERYTVKAIKKLDKDTAKQLLTYSKAQKKKKKDKS